MCNFEDMEYQETLIVMGLLLMVAHYRPIESCRGTGFIGDRDPPRYLSPLVFRQHIPNISETTVGASGPAEGAITRGDKRFKDLVPNYNPDIVFKNEEDSDADRWMSKRCRDRLNLLATMVQNQWPHVKLRVTEAWDEDGDHTEGSLHFEGRAVDITTDDRDHDKYGMLARLAVEAGFDWVFYESKHHIHASVMADDSPANDDFGGCFPADSTVTMESGEERMMSQLKVGDRILTADRNTGETKATDVILLMHKDEKVTTEFLTITATSGRVERSITLTPNHLVFIHEEDSVRPTRWRPRAIFAEDVSIGDRVYLKTHDTNETEGLVISTVTTITSVKRTGVYAPLTEEGTIIVDRITASSYAVFDNERVSHALFLPMRILWRWGFRWGEHPEYRITGDGVHWYPSYIFNIASAVLPAGVLKS